MLRSLLALAGLLAGCALAALTVRRPRAQLLPRSRPALPGPAPRLTTYDRLRSPAPN